MTATGGYAPGPVFCKLRDSPLETSKLGTTMSADPNSPPPPSESTDWTEQQLPPVKPPTTGFLMQLFFVPMIIVSIIVAVWIMFGWLAQSGTNPKQLSENLRRLNKGSWQDAHSLSNLLRDPREKELRQDTELAASLSETLSSLIEDPNLAVSPERQELAMFLCHALGEFEVIDGLPTLQTAVDSDVFKIRKAAVEGITKLSAKLDGKLDDSRAGLVAALREPAMERAPSAERQDELMYGEMRSAVAYCLGVVGGDDAKDTLALMLGDPYPEARYNAATGLARHGDLRAVERLLEMLQLNNEEATKYEDQKQNSLLQWKRNMVIANGVRGLSALYKVKQDATPTAEVIAAVQAVQDAQVFPSNDSCKYELDELSRILVAEK